MIDVLYFSDKAVKQKLFARVTGAKKLTLVAVLPPHRAAKDPRKVDPFKSLERDFGAVLDQVLVVDEGKVEGMWRDPVVDLADAVHASDAKAAYAAARGYLFVQNGEAQATVKKSAEVEDDLDVLEKTIERLTRRRPRKAATRAAPSQTLEDGEPRLDDAWAVLGLSPGASLDDAKAAWKSLVIQYHPDKVAHLAPEFRELAEKKTRELMQAWEQIQASLK